MEQFVTDHKKDLMRSVLNSRTKNLALVLEDIYQPHNASAVIRSCECFGISDIHVIEKRNAFSPSKDIALGSANWVNIHKHNQENPTLSCLKQLKNEGYKIVATSLRERSVQLPEFQPDGKIALCFGTEEIGLSEEALELADHELFIPMQGFTQSLNISVSAAICLYDLTQKIRSKPASEWKLSQDEQDQTYLDWLIKSAQNGDKIFRAFVEDDSQ